LKGEKEGEEEEEKVGKGVAGRWRKEGARKEEGQVKGGGEGKTTSVCVLVFLSGTQQRKAVKIFSLLSSSSAGSESFCRLLLVRVRGRERETISIRGCMRADEDKQEEKKQVKRRERGDYRERTKSEEGNLWRPYEWRVV